jgi:hypothetical protein
MTVATIAKIVESIKNSLNAIADEANTFKLEPYQGDLAGVDGWVAPDGTFYACSYYDHLIYADKLVARMGYKRVNRFPYELNGEYTLEKNGWVKISLGRVVVHKDMSLTKKQLDFLFDYYISNSREEEFMEILEKHENN